MVYENVTVVDGEVFELSGEAREFLRRRGHRLTSTDSGAVCQFIVQDLLTPVAAAGDETPLSSISDRASSSSAGTGGDRSGELWRN